MHKRGTGLNSIDQLPAEPRPSSLAGCIFSSVFSKQRRFCTPVPMLSRKGRGMNRPRAITLLAFITGVLRRLGSLAFSAVLPSLDDSVAEQKFADLYSYLLGSAEHSMSVPGCDPITVGDETGSPVGRLNRLIAQLWDMPFGRLSPGGSSGALLTTLVGVVPKIAGDRSIILIDCLAHQSAFGALGLAGYKTAIIERKYRPEIDCHEPLRLEKIRQVVESIEPDQIAAVLIVSPTYDGFRDVEEEKRIVDYLRAKGIVSVFDAAWGSACTYKLACFPAFPRPDILICSPHKKSLTASSHGVILTTSKDIADAIDETGRCGTVSTSPSYINLMVSEHRLLLLAEGDFTSGFLSAQHIAECIAGRITEVHPRLSIINKTQVRASHAEPTHLLINTIDLGMDARAWAEILSARFGLICEKATRGNLLLLIGSDMDSQSVEALLEVLKSSLGEALHLSNANESFDHAHTEPT